MTDTSTMMFIIRSSSERPQAAGVEVKLARPAPARDAAGQHDFFCVAEAAAMTQLRDAGWKIVELHDGYYEDGRGGGVAIWGQGRYWEIRSDPLTVVEAVGAADADPAAAKAGEHVEVRRAIFGA